MQNGARKQDGTQNGARKQSGMQSGARKQGGTQNGARTQGGTQNGARNKAPKKSAQKPSNADDMQKMLPKFKRTYLGNLKPDLKSDWSMLKSAPPGSSWQLT